MRRVHTILFLGALSVANWGKVTDAAPLGTAFTYQGQLKQDGAPVTGSCDFQFGLWTAQGGGSQVGGTYSPTAVTVVNGLFEVQIEFGAASFPGEARWLEVAVRCPTGVGGFTPLPPREALTATPYALQTRGLFVNDALKVGIGTPVPTHSLTIGSADQETLRLIGPLGGFGWGARLNFGDGDFAFLEEDTDDNLNFRAGRFAFSEGRVGIGTALPTARLDVLSSGETAVQATTNWIGVYGVHQGDGSFPGVWGETESTSNGGSGVRGFATAAAGGSYGVFGKCSSAGGVGVHAENTANGTAISALGNGSFREQATLRVENTQPNAGMAAYVKSQGSWAAMHLENTSTGEVLWLQNDGEGAFIVAHDISLGQHQFWVDKDGKTNVRVIQIHGGADLSEKFDVNEGSNPAAQPRSDKAKIEPGTIVVIDPDHPGKLRVSNSEYDRTVAGVISGAGGVSPGMILGHTGTSADGEHPVALSGRVYCLCDSSNGPIRPGDLLTTSSVPGHAMRVTDHQRAQGAIIGKAMSPLGDGNGLVLVLVSLQ